jgi:hypothetical protein
MRALVFIFGLASVGVSAAAPVETYRFVVDGRQYCAEHRIPLTITRGYRSARPVPWNYPVTYFDCADHTPNHIWPSYSLVRDQVHGVRTRVYYCRRCEAKFQKCYYGEHTKKA